MSAPAPTQTIAQSGPLSGVIPRRLSDAAADAIRNAILQGSLQPGTRLIERTLSAQLNMSRIPVREAVERLVDEGLLSKIPHRGIVVAAPTRDEIEEISSLRIALEQFAVERVIARLDQQHEAALESIVRRMREACSRANIDRVFQHDLEFHRMLWVIAGHSLLLEIASNLRSRISWFLYQAAHSGRLQLDHYASAHEQLLDVLRARDVTAACLAFKAHILEAQERILSVYDALPSERVASERASAS
jgi:DNA-binding GntR family transcriptional regulator